MHTYTPFYPPIVYGDTRNLRLAPHNAAYDKFHEHLVGAGIKFEMGSEDPSKPQQLSDWFIEAINNFRKPVLMAKSNKSDRADSKTNKSFNLISSVDFNKVVLPW